MLFLSRTGECCKTFLRSPPLSSTGSAKIDPFHHQREIRRFHLHVSLAETWRQRKTKPSPLQTLVEKKKAARLPKKNLQTVPPAVHEHEEMTRKRIPPDDLPRRCRQTIMSLTKIHGLGRHVDPNRGGERQQLQDSTTPTNSSRTDASKSDPTATRRPFPSTSSTRPGEASPIESWRVWESKTTCTG